MHNQILKYLLFSISLFYVNTTVFAQRDTIILQNKDKIIGEIKNLDKGVLTVKTTYSDSDFKVKWLHVASVTGIQNFIIILRDGRKFNSKLNSKNNSVGYTTIEDKNIAETIKINEIVYINKLKNNFWNQLTADISVGYNFTKSNDLSQFIVRGTMNYVTFKWVLNSSFNSVVSTQKDAESTKRTNGTIIYNYLMKNKWFLQASADFLSNDEQKLNLRSTFGVGVGKFFIRTNVVSLSNGLGIAYNNEIFDGLSNTTQNSAEAFFALNFDIYDFADDLDFTSSIIAYPSLTQKKRFRSDINANLKYDLPYDLFIKFGVSYNFDNKPTIGGSTNDYVIQTTFGWDFN